MPFTANENDTELLARLGIDPVRWADEYMKMPHDREHPDRLRPQLAAWFHHAIKAGRDAGILNLRMERAAGNIPAPPAEGRTPLVVRCTEESCHHEWIVVWLPMELETVARVMQIAACPMCGNEAATLGGAA